jgi:predicted lactoylglutathione lyase
MKTVEQLRNVAHDLIASYDARLDAVGTIIDNTYQILDDFKEKRTKLSTELRETLAKRESLRRKDFDRMMNGVLLSHQEREKEIKQDLKNFLEGQKKEARELKDALMQGEVERMKKAQIGIESGIAKVKGLLKTFYEEQEGLARELGKLLTKGNNLKRKDFKQMIENLQTRKERVKKMGLQDVVTDIKRLGQDMAASHADRAAAHADRTASIETLLDELRQLIKTFQEEHTERKAEVTQMLESFTKSLRKEVDQLVRSVQSENAQRRAEVSDLLGSVPEDLGKEVNKLLDGFRKENRQTQREVGALANAVKEMWSSVAAVKGGTKKVGARSYAEAEPEKPAKRGRGKRKKYGAS